MEPVPTNAEVPSQDTAAAPPNPTPTGGRAPGRRRGALVRAAVAGAVVLVTGFAVARPALPTQLPIQVAGVGVVAAPNSAADAAIQQTIQRANDEQAQAIASGNPSVMADTATSNYYQQLQQTNADLADNGVTAIKLVNLEWGAISVNGSQATATTYETWSTTYSDGTTEQSRDQNDYTLVQVNGAWQIASDDHPGDAANQPGGNPSTTPSNPSGPQPRVPSGIPGGPGSLAVSNNWAGYAATGGTYTAVTGTWTVPQFSATGSAGVDATWVGIGGVTSRDLLQAGTQETTSGSGATQYQAWVETLPQASRPVPLAVSPGDSITVSISQQSGPNWLVSFADNTTGQSYQTNVQYQSTLSSAEWIEEAPSSMRGGMLPLDNFGSVSFTGGSTVKDGQTDSISAAGAQAITMVGAGRQALATSSALGSDGSSFTVTRSAAASTQPFPRPTSPRGRRFGG